jgi:hypothetical protein
MRDPAAGHAIGSTGYEESFMTHDSHDSHGAAEPPSQGIFIGWLAVGLLVLMALFTLLVIGSGASSSFK